MCLTRSYEVEKKACNRKREEFTFRKRSGHSEMEIYRD